MNFLKGALAGTAVLVGSGSVATWLAAKKRVLNLEGTPVTVRSYWWMNPECYVAFKRTNRFWTQYSFATLVGPGAQTLEDAQIRRQATRWLFGEDGHAHDNIMCMYPGELNYAVLVEDTETGENSYSPRHINFSSACVRHSMFSFEKQHVNVQLWTCDQPEHEDSEGLMLFRRHLFEFSDGVVE